MTIKEIDAMCLVARNKIQAHIEHIWMKHEWREEMKISRDLFLQFGISLSSINHVYNPYPPQ